MFGLLLALAVLGAVLWKLDLQQLAGLIRQARWPLVAAALPMGLLVVGAGAWRYRTLATAAGVPRQTAAASLLEYWRSLAIGLLAPGSLGSDAYRVLAAVQRSGRALPAASAVVAEKAVALLACVALAGAALPAAAPAGLPLGGADLRWWLLGLGLAVLVTLATLPLLWRWAQASPALAALRAWLQRGLVRATRRLAQQADAAQRPGDATGDLPPAGAAVTAVMPVTTLTTLPAPSPAALLRAVGWSLLALALSAVQAHLFFAALGQPVPLAVNLLVAPLLFITFALPLSIGGLGVRELAFMGYYGACGVPAEAALVVSSFSLASQLLSHGLGVLALRGAAGSR